MEALELSAGRVRSIGKIESSWDKVLRVLAGASALCLLAITLMVSTDVIVRAITGRPIIGVYEITGLLLGAVFFLAIGTVEFRGEQLKVDILSARARGRTAEALRVLDALAGFAFFSLLFATGAIEWLTAYRGGFMERGMVEFPTTVPLGTLVFGSAAMCVTLLLRISRSLRRLLT